MKLPPLVHFAFHFFCIREGSWYTAVNEYTISKYTISGFKNRSDFIILCRVRLTTTIFSAWVSYHYRAHLLDLYMMHGIVQPLNISYTNNTNIQHQLLLLSSRYFTKYLHIFRQKNLSETTYSKKSIRINIQWQTYPI